MKPFNLERALAGDPVGTMDGNRKVIQLFHADKAKETHRVLAIFDNGFVKAYTENGLHFPGEQSSVDLVMLPKIKTYWYAVLMEKSRVFAEVYESKIDLEEAIELLSATWGGVKLLEIRSIDVEEND